MAPSLMTILRLSLVPLVLSVLAGWMLSDTQVAAQDSSNTRLGIGSKAPAIDIENWIQDGGGKLEPVTTFEDGQVYVVEFWATWCGPCIQSMPHLSELQQKYADQVRLVSVTDETVDEVDALLQQTYPNTETTFEEITTHYSLTADPDGSTHRDYMEAAEIGGIPSAFLIGKTGLVEWIGHPMALDKPLEDVLNDTWDREAEKERREREMRIEKITREMSMLARQGRYDDAVKLIEDQIAATDDDNADEKDYWRSVIASLKMSAGKLDDEAISFYREKIGEMDGDVMSLIRFSFSLFEVADSGGSVGPLAGEADAALARSEDSVESGSETLYHYARALLGRIDGNFEMAIEQLGKAVDSAGGKQKERFAEALEELKADAEKAKNPDTADGETDGDQTGSPASKE